METLKTNITERRKQTRSSVYQYLYNSALPRSKLDISRDLNLSLPTVYQNVDELLDVGYIEYCGAQQSSGGRPAMQLRTVDNVRYAIGIYVTPSDIHFSTTDLSRSEISYRRIPNVGSFGSSENNAFIARELENFIDGNSIPRERLLGVGISLPGVINLEETKLLYAPTLGLRDIDLVSLRESIPYPTHVENDATSGGFAEWYNSRERNSIAYLSLAEGVGGTILVNGALHAGNSNRSGEFGHMCVEWNGKPCACGKRGCLEAYCSSLRFRDELGMDAEEFFFRLKEKDPKVIPLWNDYKKHLVMGIHNIRIALDCEVVLGGFLAEYLGPYLPELRSMLAEINPFDTQCSFLRIDRHPRFGSIIGVAFYFIRDFIDSI